VVAIDSTGLAVPVQSGSVEITATYGGLTALPSLVTAGLILESIEIQPLAVTLRAGDRAFLALSGLISDGEIVDLTDQAEWTTGDPAVATVDAAGVLYGQAAGTTTVNATWNGFEAIGVPVTVLP
jgi:hypothetical protein